MTKQFIDKYIKIPLSLLLTLFLLTSCGIVAFNTPETEGATETSVTIETEPPYQVSEYEQYDKNYSKELSRFLQEIPDADYGGGSFLIATPKPSLVLGDETVSTVLSKNLETRNNYIQTEYNITVSAKNVNPQIMFDEIKIAIKSVSYYADLIMIPQNELGRFAVAGCVTNLSSLPGFNANAKYYNASSVEAGGGKGKIYGVAGPASVDPDCLSAVFFNKSLMSEITEDNVYKLVRDGQWTWDKFLEYSNAVSTIEGDYYSIGTQNTALYIEDLIFISAGMKYSSCDGVDLPKIAFTAETADPIVELIKQVKNHEKKYTDNLSAISAFSSGNTLFLIDDLSTMKTISSSICDWGVLPLPKKTAEQKAYTTLVSSEDALVYSVVPTVSDSQKSANLLALLNIVAYGDTPEAYAEEALSYYLRDNSSAGMVETIINSATFDLVYGYSVSYDTISTSTFQAIRYPSNGHRSVDYYLRAYGGSFNYAVQRLFGK
ncbi:MAG: extracellular solute-binding protein [Clostridia bacterium]|nr:extracellular solute-binding protein [Clostridia bacterium]